MARKRKTFDIAELLFNVNIRNKNSTCDAAVRQGWNSLLESVLHSADVYQGFEYLEQPAVPWDQKPGIQFVKVFGDIPGPCDTLIPASEYYGALFVENEARHATGLKSLHTPTGMALSFPDESRRGYFVAHPLVPRYQVLTSRANRQALIAYRAQAHK